MPVYSVHVYAPTVNPFWSYTGESAMYNVSGTSTVGSFNVVDILDDDAFINDTDPGA
ncbi:hypothetical protein [Amylibacter sp. IMCC11727]|uniref:hypothetical protein n=1 Tax=Amylibacter sp. IMCC11727 TaxID=3039851 RepID=UPI00244E3193|nr:hypothetical protein [Amylibacter sp. IMCC11727]WGI23172.1 hypothetical protein QBD29_07055 [Amylibacter sp. IMCC11727]